MNEVPRIEVKHQPLGPHDKTPYRASAWFSSGRHYHSVAATPAEAIRDMAIFWMRHEGGPDSEPTPPGYRG